MSLHSKNRFAFSVLVCLLVTATFVQAVNIGGITTVTLPVPVQGYSLIFGRWDASTYYCMNGTTGVASTGAFSTLWNANVQAGDLVCLMSENFTVTAALAVPDCVTVRGSGRGRISSDPLGGTVLTLEYSGNVFVASGNPSQGVSIRDLTINGQRHQRTLGNAVYGKFRNIRLENVYIMDMDESGVFIEDATDTVACWDNHILNCDIWWCDEYGVRMGTRATDGVIQGGHIAYCDIAGFYSTVGGHRITATTLDMSHYNIYLYAGGAARLTDCNLDQAHRYNVYIQATSGHACEMISIKGGKISKSSVEADDTYAHVYIQGYGTGDASAARDIVIMGVIFANGGAGLGKAPYCLQFAGINERDITITGNDFRWGYSLQVCGSMWPTSSVRFGNEGDTQETDSTTYLISQEGDYYYSLNTRTLSCDYSGTTSTVSTMFSSTMTVVSATGGSIFVKQGDYWGVAVTVKTNVNFVLEFGVENLTYSTNAGATCIIQDRPNNRTYYYVGGVLLVSPGAPTYTVWKSGTTYLAMDAYGWVAFSSTNASYVTNSVIAPLSTILLVGTMSFTNAIWIHENNVTIYGHEAYLSVADSANMFALFNVTGNCTHLYDLNLRGNRDQQSQGHGISQANAYLCRYENLDIQFFKDDGIHITGNGNYGNNEILFCHVVDCSGYGVYLYQTVDDLILGNDIGGVGNSVIECVSSGVEITSNKIYMGGWNGTSYSSGSGIHIYAVSGTRVYNNRVSNNGANGIQLDYCENCTLNGNFVNLNNMAGVGAPNSCGIKLSGTNSTIINGGTAGNMDQPGVKYQEYGIYLDADSTYNVVLGIIALQNTIVGITNLGDATNQINLCYNGTTWIP